MIKFMQRNRLHHMKTSRFLPNIGVIFQVQFVNQFDKCESSWLHIVAFYEVGLRVKYL